MRETKRDGIERRSGKDRRRAHNLDYFINGGIERRGWTERRSLIERRNGWIRVSEWVSASFAELGSRLSLT